MSKDNDKEDNDFEFIQEQIIEKKRKKIGKYLPPMLFTVFMAILFGIIAAFTFVIAEPKIYDFMHHKKVPNTPIKIPSAYPEETEDHQEDDSEIIASEDDNENSADLPTKPPVILETIAADIEDFSKMYTEIKKVANQVNKSIVSVCSNISGTDMFGEPVEKKVLTNGILIAKDNTQLYILLSFDRVEDASNITVEFANMIRANAVIHDYERELNLAIISVKLEDIPFSYVNSISMATLGESFTLSVGNPIIALGCPNGHPNSMQVGIVTSKGSFVYITDNRLDLFNTDIGDNKSSDGFIMNLKGELIGVITRTLKQGVNEELSTVIGISKLTGIIEKMVNKEPRTYFGVKTEDMTGEAKAYYEILNGIYVNEVKANSPALKAGIKNGDIILEVNNQIVINSNNFYNLISKYKPQDEVKVKIKRTSASTEKELEVMVTLGATEEE
ncbi:MAG TPA: PDZ domain-containing protein [Clostridiales bacterium]|jgi:S1-C subfamily serine protease|nr:PDZ domain-containing protein [Clostridiales bacterium]